MIPDIQLSCLTQPGVGNVPFFFQVQSATDWTWHNNVSGLAGVDNEYFYPQAPIVTAVSGCVDGPFNTSQCPTAGGTTITIHGQDFPSDNATVIVRVGSQICTITAFGGTSSLQCSLPAGVGANQPVVVQSGKLFSQAQLLLSYAPPTLSTITSASCTSNSGQTALSSCPRAGNVTVTLSGSNFGL